MHTKVKIIDRDLKEDGTEYGEYWQEPNVHLKGCGHPLKGIIKFIEGKKIEANKCFEVSKNLYKGEVFTNVLGMHL